MGRTGRMFGLQLTNWLTQTCKHQQRPPVYYPGMGKYISSVAVTKNPKDTPL